MLCAHRKMKVCVAPTYNEKTIGMYSASTQVEKEHI
jgi:hypothetical protein